MRTRFAKQYQLSNVFQRLSDDDALYLLGLSLAANDLMSNLDALKNTTDSEHLYFFTASISILRELASLVNDVDNTGFLDLVSDESRKGFALVRKDLLPFNEGALVKSTLKPIRDVTFHYNYSNSQTRAQLVNVLETLRKDDSIVVGCDEDADTVLGQRYVYADKFRSELVQQYLNSDLVAKVSAVAVNIMWFVDSVIADVNTKK